MQVLQKMGNQATRKPQPAQSKAVAMSRSQRGCQSVRPGLRRRRQRLESHSHRSPTASSSPSRYKQRHPIPPPGRHVPLLQQFLQAATAAPPRQADSAPHPDARRRPGAPPAPATGPARLRRCRPQPPPSQGQLRTLAPAPGQQGLRSRRRVGFRFRQQVDPVAIALQAIGAALQARPGSAATPPPAGAGTLPGRPGPASAAPPPQPGAQARSGGLRGRLDRGRPAAGRDHPSHCSTVPAPAAAGPAARRLPPCARWPGPRCADSPASARPAGAAVRAQEIAIHGGIAVGGVFHPAADRGCAA